MSAPLVAEITPPPYAPLSTPLLAKLLFDADIKSLPPALRDPLALESRARAVYFDPDDVFVSEQVTFIDKGKGRAYSIVPRVTFNCGICMEDEDEDEIAVVEACGHTFCR